MSLNRTSIQPGPRSSLSIISMIALLAGPFVTMLDSSIVNVALPQIARFTEAQLSETQWVASGYLLSLAVALAATAYLAKRFGTVRMYFLSLIGFTLTSALCALSPSLSWLVAARVLQGGFGAALVPLAMGMLMGKSRGQIPAAAGIVLFLAPALGPTLGGLLVHWAGWSSIFWINVPISAIACFAVLRLPKGLGLPGDPQTRFDAFGFTLLAAGLALTTYGASRGAQYGWLTDLSWPFWSVGLSALGVYIAWALWQAEHPVVSLAPFTRPQSALALLLSTLTSVVQFAMPVLIPLFLQNLQGYSAMVVGLTLLPQGLVTGFSMVATSSVQKRLGLRNTVLLGLLLLALGSAGLLLVDVSTPLWVTALILCGRGFASGLIVQPLLSVLLGNLESREAADGNTLFNIAQRVGGTLGITLLVSYFQIREHFQVSRVVHMLGLSQISSGILAGLPSQARAQLAYAAITGFHEVIWVLIWACVLTFILAWLLHDPHRAAS